MYLLTWLPKISAIFKAFSQAVISKYAYVLYFLVKAGVTAAMALGT